jgi:hypothetical protein
MSDFTTLLAPAIAPHNGRFSVVEEEDALTACPEYRLLIAILVRTAIDLRSKNRLLQEDARFYVEGDNFADDVTALGMEPESARRAMLGYAERYGLFEKGSRRGWAHLTHKGKSRSPELNPGFSEETQQ